MVAGKKIHQAT